MPEPSIDALRARAVRYREMAQSATNEATRSSLLRLAERFEDLARRKEEGRDGLDGSP
jgi:hypothetical protein